MTSVTIAITKDQCSCVAPWCFDGTVTPPYDEDCQIECDAGWLTPRPDARFPYPVRLSKIFGDEAGLISN